MKKNKISEALVEILLRISAGASVLAIIIITIFIFYKGIPLILKVGIVDFLFNLDWSPTRGSFGIGAMVIGSLAVTLASLVWSVPLGIMTAILMAEIAPHKISGILSRFVELLAGIPSVVYGFFGLIVIVPFIRNHLGGVGLSVLAGAIVLGIMILPTIINISRDAIAAVPEEYKVNSLALGATHYQSIGKVILPAAKSGIITAIVLGLGRAIGETMAVLMVTGNSTAVPDSLLAPVRTMTSNIVLEMGYAAGDHQTALFATGTILFIFIVILNLAVNISMKAGMEDGN
ncbi:MAG TPA: phosphate ABC transporter permease subunit PstC [Syntrophomonadaceae bacterium]|nr:phosphate ABC transporter permease subunit PstC [Syntrophomonadaceae bacterium]HNX29254.1 phosphate ABC transporter permease subunit PstC [Syntrophomonadaceae bacterium]HPR94104.1 phosphate ABC transporter permease subunit PstC [Syntrophomonadaceae bacterium]